MAIVWDEDKNQSNIGKHRVDFDEAATVILCEHSLSFLNRHPDGDRFEYIGFSYLNNMLFVVTVEQSLDSDIIIISARKATQKERIRYEKDKRI